MSVTYNRVPGLAELVAIGKCTDFAVSHDFTTTRSANGQMHSGTLMETVRGLVAATVPPRHQSQELMVIWQPGQCVQIDLCCRQGLPFDDVARWDALLALSDARSALRRAQRPVGVLTFALSALCPGHTAIIP